MSCKHNTPPRHAAFQSTRCSDVHTVPDYSLATPAMRTSTALRQDTKCEDLVCRRQQEMYCHERARYLYEHYNQDIPHGLICYDCGVFHQRIQYKKQTLSDYPVNYKDPQRPRTLNDFFRNRTTVPAVIIYGFPIPWLQVHQTARSLRYSPRYGSVTLDQYRARRWLGIKYPYQAVSKALLVDDRLIVCIQQFGAIGSAHNAHPRNFKTPGAETFCPHAKTNLLYPRHLSNQMIEACEQLCYAHERTASPDPQHLTSNDTEQARRDATICRDGFVHKRYRCPSCPTEYTIEVVPWVKFADAHLIAHGRDRDYVLCVSRYIDFGHCHAPDEKEWRALSTWPGRRPVVGQAGRLGTEVDFTGMEMISARFERGLCGGG